ncbi:hypothetical protein Pint_04436 [Pistacia integerrima]|uniref:Uncharacterized protein n=1 Tax=Pistacia integerrima TaxID=434235 RepID=A0ACC0Z7B5_9ROSI|nr:hypothetical protein Pint_04436 [Pistacia integerrima]
MKYQVLEGLRKRTRPLMAFSFVEYLAEKLPLKQGFSRSKINEIIVQTQSNITYTEFKPSVIAASALLAACTFLYPDQYDNCKEIFLSSGYFQEVTSQN